VAELWEHGKAPLGFKECILILINVLLRRRSPQYCHAFSNSSKIPRVGNSAESKKVSKFRGEQSAAEVGKFPTLIEVMLSFSPIIKLLSACSAPH
jgi:hypothetical protein